MHEGTLKPENLITSNDGYVGRNTVVCSRLSDASDRNSERRFAGAYQEKTRLFCLTKILLYESLTNKHCVEPVIWNEEKNDAECMRGITVSVVFAKE